MFFECTPITLTEGSIMFSLFLGGLLGGLTHCAFMCAPFVVMMQQKTQEKQMGRLNSILLLPYHLGRMVTYVGLGVLANLFLLYAFPVSDYRYILSAFFLAVAGLIFLVQSVPFLSGYFPFLLRFHLPVPLKFIQTTVTGLLEKQTFFHLFLVGIMLGFIPCGLVMGALLAVAGLPDPWHAALGMSAFALGTTPSLMGVACGGKALATIFPSKFRLLTQWVLVVNGIVLLAIAGWILS